MRTRKVLWAIGLMLATSVPAMASTPKLMSFHGILKDGVGNPVADGMYTVAFTIYEVPTGGTALWAETTSVTTAGGLFTGMLGSVWPIPDSVFVASNRYIGVKVASDPELSPRVQLVSVGYAYRVNSVDSALGGNITTKVSIGPGHTNTGADAFVAGAGNQATGDLSTIGGGGLNTASGANSTVGGGDNNHASGIRSTVGGGAWDTASGTWATVGGGEHNVASGQSSTISGGTVNVASGPLSAVGGGGGNTASGILSTICGGSLNLASGDHATVAAGKSNAAAGNLSYAAGFRAKAHHFGSYVWADTSVDADFASTANNQYLIRAAGGVGVNTASPTAGLDVNGSVAIGSGTPIQRVLSAVAALDFPNTAAGGSSDMAISVTGASTGDVLSLGVPNGSVTAGANYWGWVSSANTVTVRFTNATTGAANPSSGTFRAMVTKF